MAPYANAVICNQNYDLSDYFLQDLQQAMRFTDSSREVFSGIVLLYVHTLRMYIDGLIQGRKMRTYVIIGDWM